MPPSASAHDLFRMTQELFVNLLARCFLAGEPSDDSLVQRASQMLGHQWEWLRPVVSNYPDATGGSTRPRHRDVVNLILRDDVFQRAWNTHHKRFHIREWLPQQQRMQPVIAAQTWQIPRIESARELADWFWLTDGQLEWFADLHGLAYKTHSQQLRHYHYRILEKTNGGVRLIEAPKPRLKEMQRQILDYILDLIPAHSAVHGFVKDRSIKTFAAPHVGQHVVLRLDVKNFFPSFSGARVQALFRTIGFPEMVADLLAGICTTATPAAVWKTLGDENYSRRHLPQGSPSSPALANLCAYRTDCRLTGLAECCHAQYTRYADDLAFSGGEDFARRAEKFALHAAAILLDEGLSVNHRKTHSMRQGVRQHLAGLVTNQHLNVSRREFDALKATLTNCLKLGPESQNRNHHPSFREHLNGRIGFIETVNRSKGAKLRKIFASIAWPLL